MVNKYPSDQLQASVNATLREINKLQTDRRSRDAQGAFFVEGVRNFVQLVDHHFPLVTIVYSEKLLTNPLARKFVRQFRRDGVPPVRVNPEIFRKFSQTRRASGIGAIVRQRWSGLKSVAIDKGLCWVILGLVRSSGNFGTLIRTSEAVGGAGFILLDQAVDPYNPATVRASMGALFWQQYVRTNYQALQRWVKKHNGHVIGASPDGTKHYHRFSYPRRTLFFLGEERAGLSPKQRSMCEYLVRIPMVGQADSLNLGVAGSLLLYELFCVRDS